MRKFLVVLNTIFLVALLSACGGRDKIVQSQNDMGGIHVGNPEGSNLEGVMMNRSFRSSYGYQLELPPSLLFSRSDVYAEAADFNSLDRSEKLDVQVIEPDQGLKDEADFDRVMMSDAINDYKIVSETSNRKEARRDRSGSDSFLEERLVLTPHRQILFIKMRAARQKAI